ncbi:MAG: PD-(D/E)XK nuclease family protein [Planctomycetes bacterium]|nr:PD-(D/E)XK nuclease family protein [Planctomycetota bacterium]
MGGIGRSGKLLPVADPASAGRQWLDWAEPALPGAASWLIRHAASGDGTQCDLQRVVCVVPGLRAGRLLLAQLAGQCLAEHLHLIPPLIRTPGQMVDTLAPHGDVPTATAYEQVLAWMAALRSSDQASIKPLLPHPPAADDLIEWYDLAATIARLADELAGEGVAFADVTEQAERMELFGEGDRWRALEALDETYRAVLAEAGLVDTHQARWQAIRGSDAPEHRHLVLIGVLELNAMQRAAVSERTEKTTALIHAPASLGDRFDELGCVDPTRWEKAILDVPDEQIVVADRPDDQAQAVLQAIADLDGRHAPEQITIGLGDESLAEALARAGRWAGLTLHAAAGRPLRRTGQFRLLAAGADWLADQRFANLAALVRHPDLEAWLLNHQPDTATAIESWQTLLDEYFSQYLHERCDGQWLGDPTRQRRLKAVYDAINALYEPLRGPGRRTLGEWAQRVLGVLREVYGSLPQDAHAQSDAGLVEACAALRDVCAEVAAAQSSLQATTEGWTAVRLLLSRAATERLPVEPRRGEIEMLGWLELHLDVAPAVIVAGFNDGRIPAAVTGDAFLPDTLRRRLGLTDNTRRYARDAYILEALRHSRKDLTIVMGRHTAQGEPLVPSRLLLACERSQLPARIKLVCDEQRARTWRQPVGIASPARSSQFEVPPLPPDLQPPQVMRVTWFGEYLRCRYRFALRRLVRLQSKTDTAMELDPPQFGNLAHEVLRVFGEEEAIVRSADAQEIEAFLLDALEKEARRRFGEHPMPAVHVQIARLAHRLGSFARFQAKQREAGWIIQHSELKFTEANCLDVPGQAPMPIRGRIDRIDQHEGTGAWRIIDYKTGESGESPYEIHHGRKTLPKEGDLKWQDLQLPLYHYLAAQHGMTGDVELAYIVLPKQTDGVTLLTAQWGQDHLAGAIEIAREIVRDVRAGRYEMNSEYSQRFDDFARICQTFVFAEDEDRQEGGP